MAVKVIASAAFQVAPAVPAICDVDSPSEKLAIENTKVYPSTADIHRDPSNFNTSSLTLPDISRSISFIEREPLIVKDPVKAVSNCLDLNFAILTSLHLF